MPELDLRVVGENNWRTLRSLRLRALEDAPMAFLTTLEQARARPDEEWRSRLSNIDSSLDLPLLACVDGQAVGMAWGHVSRDTPFEAQLLQMWVDPAFRGRGVGAALVERVIRWAAELNQKVLRLAVSDAHPEARRLYERCGFHASGPAERQRDGEGGLYTPMALVPGARTKQ